MNAQPIEPRKLAGRCANGAERDRGVIYHAVERGQWAALCGREPGRTSAGWSDWKGSAVTCPRCLKKLATRTEET